MFAHVSIRTADIERSIDFYGKYFGMKPVFRKEIPQTESEIVFLESDGTDFRLELTWYKKQSKFIQAEYEHRTFDHLAFIVKGMDTLLANMRSGGVTITDEPYTTPSGSKIAFIEDPDGTLIELIERLG